MVLPMTPRTPLGGLIPLEGDDGVMQGIPIPLHLGTSLEVINTLNKGIINS